MQPRWRPVRSGAGGWTAGRRVLAIGLAAGIGLAACVDPTHDAQVQALGGEAPGVPHGPLHRPGQPCLVCHGEAGPASQTFVMAGTVFATQGSSAPASGVQVVIEDVNGAIRTPTTNEAGNFYITSAEWSPKLPAEVQISKGMTSEAMLTLIGRDGSCADCHTQTPGPTSPGPVYLNMAQTPGGGT
jgi:hypothetical protein